MMTTYDDLVRDIGLMEHGCDAVTKHREESMSRLQAGYWRGDRNVVDWMEGNNSVGWKRN